MSNLLLITNNFPYGAYKEAFLETEIIYLSRKFDKIYIVATKSDSEFIRKVPDNVFVSKFSNDNLVISSFITFFRYLFPIFFLITKELRSRDFIFSYKNSKMMISHGIKAFLIRDYILKKIKSNKISVLYSYWFSSAALAAGLVREKDEDIKVISRLHGWDLYTGNKENDYFPFMRLKALLIDYAFFISDHGKNYFEVKYGKSEKYKVAKLGVKNNFKPNSENKFESGYTIVSCSNFNKIKRVDLIIRSLAIIVDIKINWIHIGGGENNEDIHALANSLLKNKDNISFHWAGIMSNSNVYDFYSKNRIDLFINTSSTEGLPVSIMEAMSFGIPVIATDVGGTGEIVNSGCGILLNKECTPDEIACAITGILKSDRNTYSGLCRSAYENWVNNFNADTNYSLFADEISAF